MSEREKFIETGRLILRRWRKDDFLYLAAILADPDVMKFSDHGPLEGNELLNWLQKVISDKQDQPPLGMHAITLKSDGTVIGYINLSCVLRRISSDSIELGLRLAKTHWQQGYGNEAAEKMIGLVFEQELAKRVVGIVDPENHQSVHMLKKLGMVFEKEIEFEGYDHPDHVFQLTADQ